MVTQGGRKCIQVHNYTIMSPPCNLVINQAAEGSREVVTHDISQDIQCHGHSVMPWTQSCLGTSVASAARFEIKIFPPGFLLLLLLLLPYVVPFLSQSHCPPSSFLLPPRRQRPSPLPGRNVRCGTTRSSQTAAITSTASAHHGMPAYEASNAAARQITEATNCAPRAPRSQPHVTESRQTTFRRGCTSTAVSTMTLFRCECGLGSAIQDEDLTIAG